MLINWQSEEGEPRTGFDRCVNSLSAVCFDSSQSDLRIFQDDAQSFTFSRKSRKHRTQQFILARVEVVHQYFKSVLTLHVLFQALGPTYPSVRFDSSQKDL